MDQTYISDIFMLFQYRLRIKIKNKCENEDGLDIFLNGPNFIGNVIIIPMLLIKAIFYKLLTRKYIFKHTKFEHKGVSESIDSDDRNSPSVGLANNYSVDTSNFRRL